MAAVGSGMSVSRVTCLLIQSGVTVVAHVISRTQSCEFFAFIVARILVGVYGWSEDSQRTGSLLC